MRRYFLRCGRCRHLEPYESKSTRKQTGGACPGCGRRAGLSVTRRTVRTVIFSLCRACVRKPLESLQIIVRRADFSPPRCHRCNGPWNSDTGSTRQLTVVWTGRWSRYDHYLVVAPLVGRTE